MSEEELLAAERALQSAQLAGDVGELDRLLHPELLAVGPDGQLVEKAEDLTAHREGVLRLSEFEQEDLRVRLLGDLAVTFVVVRYRGTMSGSPIEGRMRYTRTWTRDGGTWRVLAAHLTPV
jgi:ketosteroid isomerase-like protein